MVVALVYLLFSINPTDNINPYDFYYMFLAGSDRKMGVLSGSAKIYWNNFNLEGIYVPEHTANRLPFGEEEFPIQFPQIDRFAKIIDDKYEYGFRLQSAFNWGDASISYIDGHDNNFSWLRITDVTGGGGMIVPVFGYRKTEMIGTDLVAFISEFTVRTEIGFFKTNNNEYLKYELGPDSFDPPYTLSDIEDYYNSPHKTGLTKVSSIYYTPEIVADYFQYVFQVEYSGFSDFTLALQYLGTYVDDISEEYKEYVDFFLK